MAKYLLSYKPFIGPGYSTHGFMYDLTILKVSFFGLIKKQYTHGIIIPYESNLKETFKKYDDLIANKTKLT